MKLLLLLLSLLLSACATVPSDDISEQVLLHDRRTHDGIIADRDISIDVKESLNDDETLRGGCCHININVYNGAVLVTGEAKNEDLKNKIIDIIRVIPHVTMVHDHLLIAAPSNKAGRDKDADITKQVKTALTQIQTLPDFDPLFVKVTTNNRIVYLMGRMHREEGKVVINVARLQPHVKQIVTVFDYMD